MRILIVSDAWEPQINGVVRTYQHISAELTAMGHDVLVIGPSHFISMPMPGYNEIRLALFPKRRLTRIINDFAPDYIHIAVEGPLGWCTRKYCLQNDIAFTTSFHTHFPDYVAKRFAWIGPSFVAKIRDYAIAFVRKFHAPAKSIFVATQSLETQLRAWGFKPPMVRLLRGVNLDIFHPGEKTLFNGLPRPVQIYIGRVSVEKNIEAFLSLKNEGTKVVVGAGPSLNKLQSKYPDVIFAGVQQGTSLADHYRSADVFVFPSKTDTFGIVLIEALASGIPVAGYNVTGPKDIITDPFLGSVHDDLGAAIDAALAPQNCAQKRFDFVRDNYTWENVAKTFVNCRKT